MRSCHPAALIGVLATLAGGCARSDRVLTSADFNPWPLAAALDDAMARQASVLGTDGGTASLGGPYAEADDGSGAPGDDAHPGRFFIGGRANINAGSGEPANDMPGWGVLGRYRVRGPWLLGLAVDQSTFDFETPGKLIDVQTVGVVDAELDSTTVTGWGEYEFYLPDTFDGRLRPFVGAGVGVASVGDDDVSGPTAGGTTFNFEVEGGTEIVPGVVFGVRFDITHNLVVELGGRFDYHLTEMEVRDTVSGGRTDVDDYETYGAYVGLLFRW